MKPLRNALFLAVTATLAACTLSDQNTTSPSSAERTLRVSSEASEEPAAATDRPALGSFGFDMEGMQPEVRPGDDFYAYANGKWAQTTQIPPDKSNYGMFTALADLNKERVKAVLEEARNRPRSKIGDAYASYLDQATVEAKGLQPIRPWLSKIDAITSKGDYFELLPEALRSGVPTLIGGYVDQDDKDPETYIYKIYQSGLGLPDRDMYLVDNQKFSTIRRAYVDHLAKLLTLAGEANVEERAQALFELEKRIAQVHWTREDSSDSTKTYNKTTLAELNASAPGMPFSAILKRLNDKIDELIVAQPSALQGIARVAAEADLAVLKDALRVRSLTSFSDVLPDSVANETFDFYGRVLSGTPEREPRWKRGVNFAEETLGEEIGKVYVQKYFPPETKAAMDELVANVLAAMERRIEGLDWMQPQTKMKAKQKLANFNTKVGYPERWKNYRSLEIRRDDLFGNQLRSNQWYFDDNISKLGEPVRRWEWSMLPQTVNAYANFSMNEIVFPAAILQPPFFDPNADPAINYGAIGAVIGHEISHHFDDQGAKYDENGRLSNWWTESDVEAFEKAGKALIAQYDAYEPLPGERIKGEFTLGENIGDLAGLTIAYDAYKASLGGREAPVLNGLTGDQRFFLGWAQVWRRNYRDAELSQRLITDPHSPSEQRAWVVRNLDAWYDAFDPAPTDRLYLPPEQRVRIW